MKNEPCQELAVNGRSELMGDDKLFAALVSGCRTQNAALAAGISERTAYRRLEDPEFRARLDRSRRELRESILAHLSDAGLDAISTFLQSQSIGNRLVDELFISHRCQLLATEYPGLEPVRRDVGRGISC